MNYYYNIKFIWIKIRLKGEELVRNNILRNK